MKCLSVYSLMLCLLLAPCNLRASEPFSQDIELFLNPSAHQLRAIVQISRVDFIHGWPNEFFLAGHAVLERVSADNQEMRYHFENGRLQIPGLIDQSKLLLEYHVSFSDPIPTEIVGIEDPSYGINATISSEGAYLSANSGWHPTAPGFKSLFTVKITGKDGLTGVTSGRMMSYENNTERVSITWKTSVPQQALSLAAGLFELHRQALGDIQLLAFVSSANAAFADGYLESIRKYLEIYQQLFGPYHYEKFAVVENFYPTGYGLPGWTLLGNRVIRLPFIRTTSLPHEIAHAWWGNAVEIDYTNGNWGEGLATYVADYYLKELDDSVEAIEYRRKILRDYAALVNVSNEIPLVDFRRRMSKPEQAIGYGKAAMVFHMLRQRIGDDAFWAVLQQVARDGLGNRYGWMDLKKHFEAVSDEDLQFFFQPVAGPDRSPVAQIDRC